MTTTAQSPHSAGRSEPVWAIDDEPISEFVAVQNLLGELVDGVAQAARIEAMQAAARVDLIFMVLDVARRAASVLVSSRVSATERTSLAERAVVADLATSLKVPETTMQRLASEAWSLATGFRSTLAQLRVGAISYAHTRVILDETADLGDRPELCERLEQAMLESAGEVSAATLRRRARRIRERLEVESIDARHVRALDERRIEVEPTHDGMAWLHLLLGASDAQLIADRVGQLAAACAGGEHDTRTPSQIRADVARDLLLESLPPLGHPIAIAAEGIRPTVHVTVPVLTLLGVDDAPADLQGYGPIDAATARRLAAHAPSFVRLLTHPVDGTVLDVDRTTYRPPADLKRWLEVRDQTCRFPGCNRGARRCDADHTVDWADGGPTAAGNLAHLCRHHHRLKHETSWQVRGSGDGRLNWIAPSGRRHLTAVDMTADRPKSMHAATQSARPDDSTPRSARTHVALSARPQAPPESPPF